MEGCVGRLIFGQPCSLPRIEHSDVGSVSNPVDRGQFHWVVTPLLDYRQPIAFCEPWVRFLPVVWLTRLGCDHWLQWVIFWCWCPEPWGRSWLGNNCRRLVKRQCNSSWVYSWALFVVIIGPLNQCRKFCCYCTLSECWELSLCRNCQLSKYCRHMSR